MDRNSRLLVKLLLICLGMLVIGYILAASIRMKQVKQPEGIYIRLQDAVLLLQTLDDGFMDTYGEDERYLQWQQELAADTESRLCYGQFCGMLRLLQQEYGTQRENIEKWLKHYDSKYQAEHAVLKEDWYQCYDALLTLTGMEDAVEKMQVTILGIGDEVTDGEGKRLEEGQLLAEEGVFRYGSDEFEKNKYQVIDVYCKGEVLLTVRAVVNRNLQLDNRWLTEAETGEWVQMFYKEHEIRVPFERSETKWREQVADLAFTDGALENVRVRKDKINGKLLSIRDGEIELEGLGKYPYIEGIKVYRLYAELSEGGLEDLRIGYDYADFVLEDGKICAGLLTRDEAMENIRVLIKNSGFSSAYHERIALTSDTAFTVRCGSHAAMESQSYEAGEVVSFDRNSECLKDNRVYIEPQALTGKIQLLSVERAQGTPSYRGKMEISASSDGLVLVNELLLEEYLYSVVPSEMPASYPLEALKAQAICARTYAYRHMLHSGLAGFGAHVDDSAAYQVYNNIAENAQPSRAVRETSGSLLYFGEDLCGAYYYSTSCGFGTDAGIWKSDSREDTSYLQAARIGTEKECSGESMKDEEQFKNFIEQVHASDYESAEALYRWSYEAKQIDKQQLLNAIRKRYEANPGLVLTKTGKGYESQEIKALGELKNIYIACRGAGGVADELIIEGSRNTCKIISEYNIRAVLCNGEGKVLRQDGSEAAPSGLLPSAYFVIEVDKDGDDVVGYKLTGGGFGHGVGMSQNGAKEMARRELTSEEILTFFYRSCEIRNVYDGDLK